MPERRVRVGIDVGGTFTKAVAIDARTGMVLAKSTVPTTHSSERGVSEGVVGALRTMLARSDVRLDEIEIISHSTTQAINALLESDVYKVGIVAMGVGPTKGDVVKRTRLRDETGSVRGLKTSHAFLDTSHLISEEEVRDVIDELRRDGAEVIVATEAFGVDDPSNELFVMNAAAKLGVPCTSSHEISGIYGLEIRTLTSVINASVLPKTFQVANFVERAIRMEGVKAPLMIMKGDGGVTSMETFKTKPILTVLSGPAASVAGALLYLRITNGIFIEVGGTSTNICIIKHGRPEFRYVTIRNHPTCIRSMDVRIVGAAGGSMITFSKGRIGTVGPRSAHIAGLKYSCFAEPDDLRTGEIVMIRPKPGDSEYAAIRCKSATYAITNTCAANALGLIECDDYSAANSESAKIAMQKLGEFLSVSYFEAAQSIIQTSAFEIIKTVSKVLKDYKMESSSTEIIGGGGGASVLVPFVAKQMGISYRKAEQAEVISSIGVAASMIQEELEVAMIDPTSENISHEHKRAHMILMEKGAVPESIFVDSKFFPEKSILRITAVGNVEMEGHADTRNVFTQDEARQRASEIIGTGPESVSLRSRWDHCFVFAASLVQKRLFVKKNRLHVVAIDAYGRLKLSVEKGEVFHGPKDSILEDLGGLLESGRYNVAPRVYLVTGLMMMDFSSLTSNKRVLEAIEGEIAEHENATVIVEFP